MKKLLLGVLIALLTACAPVARVIVGTIERDGSSALTVSGSVWTFDPGPTTALGVIFIAEGYDLVLADDDACRLTEETVVRCDWGNVVTPVTVTLSGNDIIAAANYRRTGSNSVYTVFYRQAQP